MNLQNALYALQQAERIPRRAANKAISANIAGSVCRSGSSSKGFRGRGRYSKGCGRGCNSRGESNNHNTIIQNDLNTCKFCSKKGHWQDSCYTYIKARKAINPNGGDVPDNDGFARLGTGDEYTGSAYSETAMEAEIIAANEGAKEIAWMEKLATDLEERSKDEPFIPTLYCNNASRVDWMQKNKFHSKAKQSISIYIRITFERI